MLGERSFLGAHVPGTADFATALVTDGTNLYLAGTFKGIEVNFNATTGTPAVTLDSRGESDAFLIKLDSRLEIDWAYRFGSPSADAGTALAIDGSGNLYLTGSVSGLSSYGMTGLGMVIFAPGNGLSATPDTYVLEVDPNGNPTISPSGPTGSGSSHATSIAVNSAGEVTIVGFYSPPILFGSTYLQAPGTTVPFVATLTMNASGGGGNTGRRQREWRQRWYWRRHRRLLRRRSRASGRSAQERAGRRRSSASSSSSAPRSTPVRRRTPATTR